MNAAQGERMKNGIYEPAADSAGYIFFAKSFDNITAAHFHSSCEAVIVAEGELSVRGSGEEHRLSRGDVFFAERYVTHLYRSVGHSVAYIWVLSDFYLSGLRSLYAGTFPMFMFAGEDGNAALLTFLERTYAEWGEYNALMRRSAAEWMLGYLAGRYPPVQKAGRDEGLLFTGVLRYIDENYGENITVASVAQKFGYSPNYFSSLFHRYTDVNFRRYLNRIRVKKAEELQKQGAGVIESAQQCGFSSMNTYYRALAESEKESGGE